MKRINRNTVILLLILAVLGTLLYMADVRPFKILVLLMLALIFSAMISGFYHLVSKGGNSDGLLKSLTWRIGLSVALFLTLVLSTHFGWIKHESAMQKITAEAERAAANRKQAKKP